MQDFISTASFFVSIGAIAIPLGIFICSKLDSIRKELMNVSLAMRDAVTAEKCHEKRNSCPCMQIWFKNAMQDNRDDE